MHRLSAIRLLSFECSQEDAAAQHAFSALYKLSRPFHDVIYPKYWGFRDYFRCLATITYWCDHASAWDDKKWFLIYLNIMGVYLLFTELTSFVFSADVTHCSL